MISESSRWLRPCLGLHRVAAAAAARRAQEQERGQEQVQDDGQVRRLVPVHDLVLELVLVLVRVQQVVR